uniref:Uncharacterized protein n=1 Tax=Romanomermis culicivorax TaxID=13658 RepID=A0A915IT05_ROMCU
FTRRAASFFHVIIVGRYGFLSWEVDDRASARVDLLKASARVDFSKNANLRGRRDGCLWKWQCLGDVDSVVNGAQWFSKGIGNQLLLRNCRQCLGSHPRCCG